MSVKLVRLLLVLLTCCIPFSIITPTSVAQDEEKQSEKPKAKVEEPESGDGATAADQPVGASEEGLQAMGRFRKPDGWAVSLFAAEPVLANPVAMFVDNLSRVFVCESFRQDRGVTDNRGHDKTWLRADLAAMSVQDRIDYHKRLLGKDLANYTAHDDRIRMLVDTDGDDIADRMTVLADKFNQLEDGTGAGVLVRGNEAYFTCIPKLWKLTDANSDGVAEQRTALHDGFGVRVAFRGHDMHGLIIGPDGRLYFSIGDRGYNVDTPNGKLFDPESGAVFRCELDGSNLEVFATGLRNPQELAFDDFGYLFTGDNNSDSGDKARWVNVMEGGDSGWRMMYQYISDRGPFNREKIWYPFSADSPAYTVPPIANIGDGPSGLTCYPGTGLSGDYQNCFFMVDFRGGPANSGIRLIRVQPQGAFWTVERSEQPIWSILATDADFGPDGALWVCDWVNGWVGEGKGRIYRFFESAAAESETVKQVQTLLAGGFTELPVQQLGTLLAHADRRIRLESQWELARRGDVAQFNSVLQRSENGESIDRLHATWGLAQAARLNKALHESVSPTLGKALADSNLHVRAAAATGLAELGITQWNDAIVTLIGDAEPRVQYAAALAAGKLKIAAALQPACKLLEQSADSDPGLRHAGIMALAGQPELATVVALKEHPSRSVRIAAVVALRKRADSQISQFLRDSDLGVQAEAARAINDVVKLHAALPELAALIESPLGNDVLAHRVLNANYRVGGAAAAQAIARFATRSDASDKMRIEALEMLGSWSSPGELDRVMNRFLPLADRDAEPAKLALKENFAATLQGSSDVQTKVVEIAGKLGITGISETLRGYASDVNNSLPLRRQSLAGLVLLDKQAARADVEKMINDSSAAMRAAAIGLYAKLDSKAVVPVIEKAIKSDQAVERQAAWDAAAKVDSDEAKQLIEEGLKTYLAGNLPPDVWLNVIEAAEGRVKPELIEQLNEFEKQAAKSDQLASYRDCILGGDEAAGKQLFFTKSELSCLRCHKVGGTGGEVGPNLTEIGKLKDNRYLLESIVNPDAKIAENFETIVLLTEDDEIISGILRKESDTAIELMNADGKSITVDPKLVVSRKKGKSSMPADLLKQLSRRELRDLVAYLSSLKGQ